MCDVTYDLWYQIVACLQSGLMFEITLQSLLYSASTGSNKVTYIDPLWVSFKVHGPSVTGFWLKQYFFISKGFWTMETQPFFRQTLKDWQTVDTKFISTTPHMSGTRMRRLDCVEHGFKPASAQSYKTIRRSFRHLAIFN